MKDKTNRWEIFGMVVGFSMSGLILIQIISDITNSAPSTMAYEYLVGYTLVTAYWTAYGFKFKRKAIWTTNLMACLFQMILLIAVLMGA